MNTHLNFGNLGFQEFEKLLKNSFFQNFYMGIFQLTN
jgi:hypothetical protein